MNEEAFEMKKELTKNWLKYLATGAIFLSLALVLLFSYTSRDYDLMPKIQQALPQANYFYKVTENPIVYEGYSDYGKKTKIGYVAVSVARGYGGPLTMIVGINIEGKIVSSVIASHKDSPGYIRTIIAHGFLDQFVGKNAGESLTLNNGIDRVSGATLSSKGIAMAIAQASHVVARNHLNLPIQEESQPFIFGLKEISIIVLLGLMLVGITFKVNNLRKYTLIGGLIFIGFVFNIAPSSGTIAGIFMGYFPPIKEYLFWYLLFLGIPLITLISGKNVYCYWICPFGAVQEFTANIGGNRLYLCKKTVSRLKKIKYGLTFIALFLAFVYNSPDLASFEPFSAFFGQQGYGAQWIILPIVIFSSFFINRFWCNYFCPVGVTLELTARVGRLLMGLWKKGKTTILGSVIKDLTMEE